MSVGRNCIGILCCLFVCFGLAQEPLPQLPRLDDLIDPSATEQADLLNPGGKEAADVEAQLRAFWAEQGLEEDSALRAPLRLSGGVGRGGINGKSEKAEAEFDAERLTVYSRDELLIVSAPALIAGELLRVGDGVRKRVGELLGVDSVQKLPCLIYFSEVPALPGEPTSILSIRSYEQLGLRIELALREGEDLDALSMQRLLVRMLLLERIAQDSLLRDSKRVPELPDWLVTGVAELVRFETGNLDGRVFRQALRAGARVKLEDVLSYQADLPPDVGQRLRELACAALVHSLQGAGEGRFLNWLKKGDKRKEGQLQELVTFFVEYGLEAQELTKRYEQSWVLLSQSSALQRYSAQESKQVLMLSLVAVALVDGEVSQTQEGLSLLESLDSWEEPDMVMLEYWRRVLLALQERVHPLFGGVVIRTRKMLEGLSQGKIELAQARKQWRAELREMEVILDIMERVELRLNEYQLNYGGGDPQWLNQLVNKPEFDMRRSLLPAGGVLQRRLDWAEEMMRLEAVKQSQDLPQSIPPILEGEAD